MYMGTGFCDPESREDVIAVFEQPAERWIGGKKTLKEVTEIIDVCIETTERQRPGVEAYFSSWKPPAQPQEQEQHIELEVLPE